MLVLTTTLPAREGDGTPEFVLTLAKALSRDFEIHIVAPRVRGARKYERVGGVTIRRFGYFPRRWEGLADGAILPSLRMAPWRVVEVPFLLAGLLLAAVRMASRHRPSVVHAHWLIPSGAVACLLRLIFGIPYIVTVHGGDAYGLSSRPLRLLKRLVIRYADVVTLVSRDMARPLGIREGEIEQLVVPMGVDVDAIKRQVRRRIPDRAKFLFVGRLADKKGIDVLLRALATVPEARLVVAGDGPDGAVLSELSRELGIDQRVSFIGRQSKKQVMHEFRTAYALVIPSRVGGGGDRDGTPVVMSEAMAAGVPVIASRLGGLAEHIVPGETGQLVEPGSVVSLANALRHALSSEEQLNSWAQRARDRMAGLLDLQTTAHRYRAFLESASQRAGGGREPVNGDD